MCLDVAGNIEGDHGADGGDVQPSGGHVGGDQKVPYSKWLSFSTGYSRQRLLPKVGDKISETMRC